MFVHLENLNKRYMEAIIMRHAQSFCHAASLLIIRSSSVNQTNEIANLNGQPAYVRDEVY
jgi:hypothetical protein